MLRSALPKDLALFPVALDDLMERCENFRKRLESLGKAFSGDIGPDAAHAWDKMPIPSSNTALWEKRRRWYTRTAWGVERMLCDVDN